MLKKSHRESFFSPSYQGARRRFRDAATTAGMDLQSHRIAEDEDLTIDVAIRGRDADPALVVSSGVHGVEGFAGSALQLALLDQLRSGATEDRVRHVLFHGLSPYGFAHLRRFNEDNVDLNRNFIRTGGEYRGVRDGYARLNDLLNPESPPSRFEFFRVKMVSEILKAGRAALRDSSVQRGHRGFPEAWPVGFSLLKAAVACGQYEYPRGLFFGGREPSRSMRIVQEHGGDWLGSAPRVLHLDVHTGLGAFGSHRLLLAAKSALRKPSWARVFGDECVEAPEAGEGVAYAASGSYVDWMESRFPDRDYQAAALEYGTYPSIRVLAALRAENRAHHHCKAGDRRLDRAKCELLECFCPRSVEWRQQLVSSGLEVIERARRALLEPNENGWLTTPS